jgi:multidrug efflux pump
VVVTLVEAVVLVFVVMLVFLQNWRYTHDPHHRGAGGAAGHLRHPAGDGLLHQRADHVRHGAGDWHPGGRRHRGGGERRAHHGEEGLPPREATKKAMGQISGAIVGITVVLVAVFVPLAFFSGSVGNIYRQFSLVMVSSIAVFGLHGAVAHARAVRHAAQARQAGHHAKTGFFGWFNRGFKRTAKGYEGQVARMLPKAGRCWWCTRHHRRGGLVYQRLPTSFLPGEDQGT